MYRIDTPHATTSSPVYSAWDGVTRYFQDTDPSGRTELSAEWLNHVQEELCYLIETQGFDLDKGKTTLLYQAVTAGIRSGKSGSGGVSDTTVHDCALVAAADCGVSGGISAAVASQQSSAVGGRTLIAASLFCVATSDARDAAVIASVGSQVAGERAVAVATESAQVTGRQAVAIAASNAYASGRRSVAFGRNVELATPDSIGGGKGETPPTPVGVDQNLTWRIKHDNGEIWTAGPVKAEGGLNLPSPWTHMRNFFDLEIPAGGHVTINIGPRQPNAYPFWSFYIWELGLGNPYDILAGAVMPDGGDDTITIRNVGTDFFRGRIMVQVVWIGHP